MIRAVTGILFVGLLTAAICWTPFTFATFFSLLIIIALLELNQLLKIKRQWIQISTVIGGVYLFLSTFLYFGGYAEHFIFFPYILYLAAILIIELFNKKSNPLGEISTCIGGQIYIAAFLSFANLLVFETNLSGSVDFKPLYIMAVFATLWINDTGAYMIGSVFGKHRMFERISPKKSWEGFFGGLVLCLIAAVIIAPYAHLHWLAAVGFALVVVAIGTLGDLIESMIKRTVGVKDAGNILPGHGGILDRIDGAIPAIPIAYMYIELFIRN